MRGKNNLFISMQNLVISTKILEVVIPGLIFKFWSNFMGLTVLIF